MSPLEVIQQSIGRIKLRHQLKKQHRDVSLFNTSTAKNIGILYNATDIKEQDMVMELVKYFQDHQKKVVSLGYIEDKKIAEEGKPYLNEIYFYKKNLSKTMEPSDDEVKNFIKEPYSILIDLNRCDCFPLEHVSSLSNAKFKVGVVGGYRDDTCDLVLDVPSDKNMEYLIAQIKHYLTIIK